ncbi:hypothetical protein KAR91_20410 [Candidatus Pacearchaeota archaeon]|nr:hypothetical protein [Candidatus Pacearchaeota archaeon]
MTETSNGGRPIGAIINDIANEVRKERDRQIRLWGTKFDAKNTANDWAAYIINYVAKATYAGRDETFSPRDFRINMMKVAALAQAAVLMIDLNGGCAPRHYENLPRSGAKHEHLHGDDDNCGGNE